MFSRRQFEKELERLEKRFDEVMKYISECRNLDEALQGARNIDEELRKALILYLVTLLQLYAINNKKDMLRYLVTGYLMGQGVDIFRVIESIEEKILSGGLELEVFSGLVKYAVSVLAEQDEEIRKQFILQ